MSRHRNTGGGTPARRGLTRSSRPSLAGTVVLERIRTVLDTLDLAPVDDLQEARAALDAALTGVPLDRLWLARSVLGASLPDADEMASLARQARLHGPWSALGPIADAVADEANPMEVRVVVGGVTCDVRITAGSDYTSGIQRVVRALAGPWASRGCSFLSWTSDLTALRALTKTERVRLLGATAGPGSGRPEVVVPWRGVHLLPELYADEKQALRVMALARYSGSTVSAIGYDCIPMTSSSTVTPVMAAAFGLYLAATKHTDRVAAISEAAAGEFEGWRQMLAGVREPGPEIRAVPLPVAAPATSQESLAAARRRLGVTSQPMVLVVGSHEPRKNHLAVLHAAETLWREGLHFTLVIAGAGSWRAEAYQQTLREMQAAGRPVQSVAGLSDHLLWAAYRLAHCTLFPSLNEGFGLPVAESLAAGTPVITSDFGSTRDIVAPRGEPVGGLLVDPHDDDEIAAALRTLLTDREVHARLREEIAGRPDESWDDYADQVWDFLVGEGATAEAGVLAAARHEV